MKTLDDAVKLAEKMVAIGIRHGRKMIAAITSMEQPLGFAAGNALEIAEAAETLKGNGPDDFLELCLIIGSFMLVLGEKAKTTEEARKMLMKSIEDGSAYGKFRQLVINQGGDVRQIDNTELLPKAKYVLPAIAPTDGTVCAINGETIGSKACVEVGAGRTEKDAAIDHAAGVVLCKKIGDSVRQGDILAYVYSNDKAKGEIAVKSVLSAYSFGKAQKQKMLLAYVDKDGVHYE